MSYDSGRILNPAGGGAWTFATLPSGAATATIPPGTHAYCSDLQADAIWTGLLWSPQSTSFSRGAPTSRNVATRIPSLSDNSSAGYSTASVWQQGGTLYTPVYCGTDSAAWAQVNESAMGSPVDVMGTTLTRFAGGTCAMLKAFTGPAIDVAVTIGGVYQIFTINILASGELDNVSLGAVMAQADAGTNCKVIKIYDQTGNGNHAALGTASGTPTAINGTVSTSTSLTVNSVTTGAVVIGQLVFGNGITAGSTIASGTGPYVLSVASATNPGPEAMYLGVTSPPYVDWDPVLGRYVIYAPYETTNGNTTNKRALQFPQTMAFTSTQNIGAFAVGSGTNSSDISAPVICALGDSSIAPNAFVAIMGSSSDPTTFGNVLVNVTGAGSSAPVAIDAQPCALVLSTASNSTTIAVNEKSATAVRGVANSALAGGWLFSYGGSAFNPYSMMKLVGLALFNAAPTAAQSAAMRRGAYPRFNIFPQVINQVALVGDSRFANGHVTPGFGVSALLPRIIGRNWSVINLATSSSTAAIQTADGLVPTVTGVAKSLSNFKGPGANYAVILIGVNDFIANSSSIASVLSLVKTLCAQIAAVGWTPILVAELATTSTSGGANVNLPLVNSAIVSAGAAAMGAAAIINVYGYTPVTTPSNANYYSDGLHPTLAVHQLLASAIAPLIT